MKARIYPAEKNPMQSGRAMSGQWVLEFEPAAPKGPEPLMGWTSSGDTLEEVVLRFESFDEAERFAKAKGWEYSVVAPRKRRVRPRNYSDNFRYIPPSPTTKGAKQ